MEPYLQNYQWGTPPEGFALKQIVVVFICVLLLPQLFLQLEDQVCKLPADICGDYQSTGVEKLNKNLHLKI